MERLNPFGDLADFAPKTKTPAKPVESAAIETIAEQHGFPSRPAKPRQGRAVDPTGSRPKLSSKAMPASSGAPDAPSAAVAGARRRYTTGRNQQINVKATAETVARFYRLADERGVPLGEVLEQALIALEASVDRNGASADRRSAASGTGGNPSG